MRRLAFLSFAFAGMALGQTSVVLLHFSDYHSHAVPFYSEGRIGQGGIARAWTMLRREHQRGAIVLNGGDMINKGSPAWSDKYQCEEWSWFNGIVDAMAFGNHDPDYGPEEFSRCAQGVSYPILSANTTGLRHTAVFRRKGLRIGVFALAGSSFTTLTKGFTYTDRLTAAREAVAELRGTCDAVVMIGHESTDEDYALARAVPGIDLIFGSHSHYKHELMRIEGTDTWFISPFQYLTYASRVVLSFRKHRLTGVEGGLVRIDAAIRADPKMERKVAGMERELEHDPSYAPLFVNIGRLAAPMSVEALAARTVALMREAGKADVALSTASSFRQPLPPGTITMEMLRAAMPYDNELVVVEMNGTELQRLLDSGKERAGSDNELMVSPIQTIDSARTYRVATTDYLPRASVYRDLIAGSAKPSGLHVRAEVQKWLAAH